MGIIGRFHLRDMKGSYHTYANCALGLLLVLGIFLLIRDLLSPSGRRDQKTTAPDAKAQQVRQPRSLQDYEAILSTNPFRIPGGRLQELRPSATVEPTPPPFNAQLIGTIAGAPRGGWAIFSDSSGRQEVFGIGESVFGMGRLRRIGKDKVHIDRNGKDEEITMVEVSALKGIGTLAEGGGDSSHAVHPAEDEAYVLDQQMVAAALENPRQIMTEARLLPYVVEGKLQGFALSEMKPGGIYQNLGLQEGDVLLRINESTISTPESALQALMALRGMDQVQLDIVRGGSRMTMTYQIQ